VASGEILARTLTGRVVSLLLILTPDLSDYRTSAFGPKFHLSGKRVNQALPGLSRSAQARKYSKNRFTNGLSSLASRFIRGQHSANPTCLRSLSHQTLADWLKGVGVANAVNVIVAALLIWLPYKLIAGSPRRWWLYGTLGLLPFAFLALIALPVWVKPLTTHYKPLEDGPLKTRIETLAARCGVTNIPVLVGGNSTGVDGLGPTHRIYLQTNLASVESPDQIEFTIGHELKHYIMGDNWTALEYIAGFLLAGFWLTDRVGRAAIRRFSRRWGFSELSDPASFPLIVFLLTFFWLASLPFFNLVARHVEHEADRFGLELTHQNHADALIFVRDAQTELAPEWGTFFLIFRADHPSIRERIEFANNYKPWEHGAPLRYSNVCKSE
jgi:STE24 endopeptidase